MSADITPLPVLRRHELPTPSLLDQGELVSFAALGQPPFQDAELKPELDRKFLLEAQPQVYWLSNIEAVASRTQRSDLDDFERLLLIRQWARRAIALTHYSDPFHNPLLAEGTCDV